MTTEEKWNENLICDCLMIWYKCDDHTFNSNYNMLDQKKKHFEHGVKQHNHLF